MNFGIVKFYDPANGIGVITPDDGTSDIAVHKREVDRAGLGQIAARQRLGFTMAPCGTDKQAVNLWATFGNR